MPRGFRDALKRFPAPGAGWGCPLRLIVVRNYPLLLREEFLFLPPNWGCKTHSFEEERRTN